MPSFSLTPLTDVPPPEQESFPQYIQFEADGTALGGPDADTLNFSTGLTATRGVGEFSNVVTVTAEGGGGLTLQFQEDGVDLGPPDVTTLNFAQGIEATRGSDDTVTVTVVGGGSAVSLLQLNSQGDPSPEEIFFFNGENYIRYWNSLVQIASDDWTWLDETGDTRLQFNAGGTYRITTISAIDADTEWPDGNTTYGAVAGDNASSQARAHTTGDLVDTRTRMQWTDQFVLTVSAESQIYLGLYALATATESVVITAQMQVLIEKIAEPAP